MASDNAIPSIFETCTPRSDVLDGVLEEDQFAASLASVAHSPDEAAPTYRDPGEFFKTTYPTEGLQELLSNIIARILAADGQDVSEYMSNILCLDTTFGGGKTHDLIATYHLATQPEQILDLDRHVVGSELSEKYLNAVDDGLSVNTAVTVGTDLDAKSARSDHSNPNHPNTKTVWGEIVYQLYGAEGYEAIKEYDTDKQAPGKSVLKPLFQRFDTPSLILIDEIADYLSKARAEGVGESNLAVQTVNFFFSLLEAASEVDNLIVVYSIADSAFADEAEEVRNLVSELNEIGKRQHKTITPTGETEVGAVLQHRLFKNIDDEAGENAVEEYFQFYKNGDRTLPQSMTEAGYKQELLREYPFHPTVIHTLTGKIDTIPKFQKTRGALKLLARAIHHLWDNRPDEYERHFFRLYDLTPADKGIRSELNETLFEFVDLDPAVKADIYSDDQNAHAQREDSQWTKKGFPALGSHITTTVLWQSLAVGDKAAGLTKAELYATLGHPDVRYDHYDSALENLAGKDMDVACHYLYDEDLIKFKAEPNLILIISQKKENVPAEQSRQRVERTLRGIVGSGHFDVQLFPEQPADVPDNAQTPSLCIMHFDSVAIDVREDGDTPPALIENLYEKTATTHGGRTESRSFKNYVLFLAPDNEQIKAALDEAATLEAIEDLLNDSQKSADLSDDQLDDLRNRRNNSSSMLGQTVRNVYRHLFYVNDDGDLSRVAITSVDASGDNKLLDAVQATLEDLDRIIKADDNARADVWFRQKLWQQTKNRMTTQQLVEQFAKKPGLEFLLSTKPLRATVARIVDEAGYAYWDGETETAYWTGSESPDNWEHGGDIADSPQVRTQISVRDVKIDEEYILYRDMESLLDQHELEPPAVCAECGTKVTVSENDSPPYLCEDCEDGGGGPIPAHCTDCGKELPQYTVADEPVKCEDCDGLKTERWETTTDVASASRALTDARSYGTSQSSSGEVAGVDTVVIHVKSEDEQVLGHALFLARQRALKEYDEYVTAHLSYRIKTPLDHGDASFSTTFDGPIEGFTSVKQQLESLSGRPNAQRRIEARFVISLDDAEPLDDDENDILAQLNNDLDGKNITVQIEAEGPTIIQVSEEASV